MDSIINDILGNKEKTEKNITYLGNFGEILSFLTYLNLYKFEEATALIKNFN